MGSLANVSHSRPARPRTRSRTALGGPPGQCYVRPDTCDDETGTTMTSTSAENAAAPDDVAGDEVPGSTATIALIASEAGVSIPTVSKVLNGRTDVAAVTRAR